MRRYKTKQSVKDSAFAMGIPLVEGIEFEFQDFLFEYTTSKMVKEIEEKFSIKDIFGERSAEVLEVYRKYFKYTGEETMTIPLDKGFSDPKEIRDDFLEKHMEDIKRIASEMNMIVDQVEIKQEEIPKIKKAFQQSIIETMARKIPFYLERVKDNSLEKRDKAIARLYSNFLVEAIGAYGQKARTPAIGCSVNGKLSIRDSAAYKKLRGYMHYTQYLVEEERVEIISEFEEMIEKKLGHKEKYLFLNIRDIIPEVFE